MKTRVILTALLFTTLFSACKKDKADAFANVEQRLQNKNWKLVSLTIHPAYLGVTDVLQEMWDPCNLDDLYQFNANNLFILNSGTEPCWIGEEQERYGYWNYEEESRILTFNLSSGELYHLKITSISDAEFKGESYDVIDGENYTARWVFRN